MGGAGGPQGAAWDELGEGAGRGPESDGRGGECGASPGPSPPGGLRGPETSGAEVGDQDSDYWNRVTALHSTQQLPQHLPRARMWGQRGLGVRAETDEPRARNRIMKGGPPSQGGRGTPWSLRRLGSIWDQKGNANTEIRCTGQGPGQPGRGSGEVEAGGVDTGADVSARVDLL